MKYLGVLVLLAFLGLSACLDSPEVVSFEDQLKKDTEAIDSYLASNNITALTDPSGLRYVITTQGTGVKPTLSNSIQVTYVGKLMSNGQVFDQSTSPVTFELSRLIVGWQIGFQLLPAGTKATLYIPSGLAYGPYGAGSIPGNANLIFDVELLDVK